MKVLKITLFADLENIEDIFDSNIDVSVELEDGYNYIVVVATEKNVLTLMNDEKSDFLDPGEPMIIVKKLTKEIIENAIEAYAEDDAYYLKFYASSLDIKTLNVLRERLVARNKLLDDLFERDESIEIKNYNLIDFDMN